MEILYAFPHHAAIKQAIFALIIHFATESETRRIAIAALHFIAKYFKELAKYHQITVVLAQKLSYYPISGPYNVR